MKLVSYHCPEIFSFRNGFNGHCLLFPAWGTAFGIPTFSSCLLEVLLARTRWEFQFLDHSFSGTGTSGSFFFFYTYPGWNPNLSLSRKFTGTEHKETSKSRAEIQKWIGRIVLTGCLYSALLKFLCNIQIYMNGSLYLHLCTVHSKKCIIWNTNYGNCRFSTSRCIQIDFLCFTKLDKMCKAHFFVGEGGECHKWCPGASLSHHNLSTADNMRYCPLIFQMVRSARL